MVPIESTVKYIDTLDEGWRVYYWRGILPEPLPYPFSQDDTNLAEAISLIEGVEEAVRERPHGHQIRVRIARAYEWLEIHEHIVATISKRIEDWEKRMANIKKEIENV